MTEDVLQIDRRTDGVAVLRVNRPQRMNALDDALLTRLLPHAFAELDEDPGVRCVVVTGEGENFCAGADLDSSGFKQETSTDAERFVRRTHATPVAIRRLRKPTIAAVRGAAVGAGFGLALACDIRFGSPTVRLGAPFISIGIVPDYGVSYFLPRVVGTATALDILYSGRLVEAEEAARVGLVSRIVDDPLADALEMATSLAEMPAHAVETTRLNVYRSMELDLEAEILEQEVRSQAVALKGSEFPERFAAWNDRIRG
ncbi:MAG: enoyl-CoA hydratase/isomerase family protein [Microthrixaceae bacterium]